MGRVILDVSMSLDGFVAGPNDAVDRLHDWGFGGKTEFDAEILNAAVKATGAVVMGRRTFDLHPSGPYGLPAFVVTHNAPKEPVASGTPITFVTDGVASAVARATVAAGDKNVAVMGADRPSTSMWRSSGELVCATGASTPTNLAGAGSLRRSSGGVCRV